MHKTTMARNWDAFPDHKRKEIKKSQTCGGCSYAVGPEAAVTCQTAYFGRQLRKREVVYVVFFFKRYFWIWIAHSVMTRPFWQCADFIFFAQIAFRKCAAATAAGTEVIKTFSYKDEFLLSLVGVTCCYHPRHCCCCCCCNYCCFFLWYLHRTTSHLAYSL